MYVFLFRLGGPNPLYDHICIQSNYNFTEAKKKIYHILRTDYCHTRHPERLKDNQLILGTIISVAIFILVCLTIVYFVKSKRKCISCFGKRRTADDQDYDQHVAIMRSLSDSSEASSRCKNFCKNVFIWALVRKDSSLCVFPWKYCEVF